MDSIVAKHLVLKLIKTVKKPASGPVQLTVDEIDNLRSIATEIETRAKAKNRARWGPRVKDLNDLCAIILTKSQLDNKGTRREELA